MGLGGAAGGSKAKAPVLAAGGIGGEEFPARFLQGFRAEPRPGIRYSENNFLSLFHSIQRDGSASGGKANGVFLNIIQCPAQCLPLCGDGSGVFHCVV